MQKRYLYALIALFLLTFGLRLFLAYQVPTFSVGEAYFNYRQVESIKDTGLPTYDDGLSFGGRMRIFPPFYYYVLSAFSFFGTVFTLKVIPNLLASSLVIIIFYLVLDITRNKNIALVSAFASGFVPIFFAMTVNSASIYTFIIPLIFYLIYCFMRLGDRKFLYQFLALSFILALTSSISLLFVLGLVIYLLLSRLEFDRLNKVEIESVLFVTFVTIWVNVIMYKKAFLFHSYGIIWQNIPFQILENYFKQVDMLSSFTAIGILPVMFGVYSIYRYMFKERDRRTYLLMAFALSVAVVLWFRLITLDVGLIFLGALLVPLAGQAFNLLFQYLEKTKISSYSWVFWILLVLVLSMTSFLPSLARASINIKSSSLGADELAALTWIRDNTPEDAVILSLIHEGDLITSIAQRRNVADTDFVLIHSSDVVYDDVQKMYTTILKTDAVELMGKYGVNYVYFSPRAKAEFGVDSLRYAEEDCFDPVYDETIQVFRLKCEVK